MWKKIEHTENDILYVKVDLEKTFKNKSAVYKVVELYYGDNETPRLFLYNIDMKNSGYIESDMNSIWRKIDECKLDPITTFTIENTESKEIKEALSMFDIKDETL